MLNIVIIEDNKNQLEDITENFTKLRRSIMGLNTFPDLEIKLIPIFTHDIEITEIENFTSADSLIGILKNTPPDILFIDYDLVWGRTSRVNMDGDEIIKIIDEETEWRPQVILASSRFDDKFYPSKMFNLKNIRTSHLNQIPKSIFANEWSLNDPNFIDAQELVTSCIQRCMAQGFSFLMFRFPSANVYANENFDKKDEFRKNDNEELREIGQEKIIAILIGYKETFAMLYLDDDSEKVNKIKLEQIHFKGHVGKNVLGQRFSFLSSDTGILFNPKYVLIVSGKYHLRADRIRPEEIDRLTEFVENHVLKTHEYYDHNNADTDHEKINPFYNCFVRFFKISDPSKSSMY